MLRIFKSLISGVIVNMKNIHKTLFILSAIMMNLHNSALALSPNSAFYERSTANYIKYNILELGEKYVSPPRALLNCPPASKVDGVTILSKLITKNNIAECRADMIRNTEDGVCINMSYDRVRIVIADEDKINDYFILEKSIASCSGLLLRAKIGSKCILASVHVPTADRWHKEHCTQLEDWVLEYFKSCDYVEALFLNPTADKHTGVNSINNLYPRLLSSPKIRIKNIPLHVNDSGIPINSGLNCGSNVLCKYDGLYVETRGKSDRILKKRVFLWEDLFRSEETSDIELSL